MSAAEKQDRGLLRIDASECKGCGLCVEACPPKVITLSQQLNQYGYRIAQYAGTRCTACGICFLVCPEPGAIRILRILHQPLPSETEVGRGMEGAPQCASD